MSSSSIAGSTRCTQAPLVECPDCHVPLIRIQSKQANSFNEWFVKCPNDVKGDPTTCGKIWSEKQYAAYVLSAVEKRGKQSMMPAGGDDMCDLRQQVAELKQRVDSVVNEVWKMKMQSDSFSPISDPSPICDRRPDSANRKMQIVLDVSVLVGVLVGALIAVVVAQLLK